MQGWYCPALQRCKKVNALINKRKMQAIRKRFDIEITAPNSIVTETFELEKTIVSIVGLLLTSDNDGLLYNNGSQRIEINGEEIFPEGYESKLLMSGVNVQPNKRFYDLESLPPGNGRIKMEYTDTSGAIVTAAFVNYRVSLYLECIMED